MNKQLNRTHFPGPSYPEKIIQFGEGNFLRAFVDWIIDQLNEKTAFNSGVTIVRPINTHQPKLDEQDGLYTTLIRGINEQGQAVANSRIIYCVNREITAYQDYEQLMKCAQNPELTLIFSNTTEAGIVFNSQDKLSDHPPVSFPAKLTQFLYHRYEYFQGQADKGLIIIPCELIDYNGEKLQTIIIDYAKLWQLDSQFIHWLTHHNTFCSTLVDRIVTGFPKDEINTLEQELGYQDRFLDTAEYFYLFVIQGPQWLNQTFHLDEVNLNIRIVDDIKPYKERKVGILNGAHTAMVPVAYLAGLRTVGEAMNTPIIEKFINNLLTEEIIPTLSLDKQELNDFAKAVLDRFRNPYIKHELIAISLNSLTKFKTRLLPQLITYSQRFNKPPKFMAFSLAALIAFYRGEYQGQTISLTDDAHLLERFKQWQPLYQTDLSQLVRNVLAMSDLWEQDLNQIPELSNVVTNNLQQILTNSITDVIPQA